MEHKIAVLDAGFQVANWLSARALEVHARCHWFNTQHMLCVFGPCNSVNYLGYSKNVS